MMKLMQSFVTKCFFSVMVIMASSCGQAENARDHVFIPLEQMRVNIGGRTSDLDKILVDFATKYGLTIEKANLSLGSRTMININLRINANSFFNMSNFSNRETLEVAAYSHDNRVIWHPVWDAFVSTVSKRLGSYNVNILNDKNNVENR